VAVWLWLCNCVFWYYPAAQSLGLAMMLVGVYAVRGCLRVCGSTCVRRAAMRCAWRSKLVSAEEDRTTDFVIGPMADSEGGM
jgi:hypothetical protein